MQHLATLSRGAARYYRLTARICLLARFSLKIQIYHCCEMSICTEASWQAVCMYCNKVLGPVRKSPGPGEEAFPHKKHQRVESCSDRFAQTPRSRRFFFPFFFLFSALASARDHQPCEAGAGASGSFRLRGSGPLNTKQATRLTEGNMLNTSTWLQGRLTPFETVTPCSNEECDQTVLVRPS